jgi:hypothetical protein
MQAHPGVYLFRGGPLNDQRKYVDEWEAKKGRFVYEGMIYKLIAGVFVHSGQKETKVEDMKEPESYVRFVGGPYNEQYRLVTKACIDRGYYEVAYSDPPSYWLDSKPQFSKVSYKYHREGNYFECVSEIPQREAPERPQENPYLPWSNYFKKLLERMPEQKDWSFPQFTWGDSYIRTYMQDYSVWPSAYKKESPKMARIEKDVLTCELWDQGEKVAEVASIENPEFEIDPISKLRTVRGTGVIHLKDCGRVGDLVGELAMFYIQEKSDPTRHFELVVRILSVNLASGEFTYVSEPQ